MASSPITGERPSSFRRSSSQFASLPQRNLSFHERAALSKEDADANVLYSHPNVRIYLFQPPTNALESLDKTKKSHTDADYPIDAIEILPWRSRTETLSAKGKLIIEKVQGSVHFMKAGASFIHTIMRNSQCWCVDGESKFVMRVGKLRYQRIEFPSTEPEDKEKVNEFKEVIAKILKFENTPCPFIRAFKVDLPEDAITPKRRGTWKRKEVITPNTPVVDSPLGPRKNTRTMSMRAMPPNSFPSRSMDAIDMERPRTASTPISSARYSFPDVRTESPVNYASGEDNTDSERHDSESDRQESSQHSEVEDSDRESHTAPIIRSPLKHVETIALREDNVPSDTEQLKQRPTAAGLRRPSTVEDQIRLFERFKPKHDTQSRSSPESQSLPYFSTEDQPTIDSTTGNAVTDSKSEPEQQQSSSSDHVELSEPLPEDNREPQPQEIFATSVTIDQELVTHGNSDLDTTTASNGTSITQSIFPANETQVSVKTIRASDLVALEQENGFIDSGSPHEPVIVATSTTSSEPPESKDDLSVEKDERLTSDLSEIFDRLQRTQTNDDVESIVSTDSFHTLQSDQDTEGSNNFDPQTLNTRPFQHRRELSEATVTAASVEYDCAHDTNTINNYIHHNPSTSQTTHTQLAVPDTLLTNNNDTPSELRQRLTRRRSLSPLPPASILRPPSPSPTTSPIPTILLQKAATLAVVKPIEVVIFVVQILARIAGGATMNDLVSGHLFRRPGGPRRTASGTFEQAIQSRGRGFYRGEDSDGEEEEDVDDYGHPVVKSRRQSRTRSARGEKSTTTFSIPGSIVEGDDDDVVSQGSID